MFFVRETEILCTPCARVQRMVADATKGCQGPKDGQTSPPLGGEPLKPVAESLPPRGTAFMSREETTQACAFVSGHDLWSCRKPRTMSWALAPEAPLLRLIFPQAVQPCRKRQNTFRALAPEGRFFWPPTVFSVSRQSPCACRNARTTSAGSRCCPSTASFIARISSAVTRPASAFSAI
jgi:hypothetical protein